MPFLVPDKQEKGIIAEINRNLTSDKKALFRSYIATLHYTSIHIHTIKLVRHSGMKIKKVVVNKLHRPDVFKMDWKITRNKNFIIIFVQVSPKQLLRASHFYYRYLMRLTLIDGFV